MSGMALNYPKKLFELADDLESFLHVLCWMALRFHRHDFSNTTVGLRALIYYHYELSSRHADGCVYGSYLKYDGMERGSLPFSLNKRLHANLWAVLRRFVRLCRIHYAAVDKSALVPFGEQTPAVLEQLTELDIDSDVEEFRLKHPPRGHSRRPKKSNNGLTDGSSAANAPSSTHHTPAPTRVLDTHNEVLGILERAMGTSGWKEDKFNDQFVNPRSEDTSGSPEANVSQESSTVPENPNKTEDTQSRKRKIESDEAGGVAVKQKTGVDSSKARRVREDEDNDGGATGGSSTRGCWEG